MIRVLIVDDQEMVVEGLRLIVGTASYVEVIGAAREGKEAVALVERLRPDVVLMDLKMPGMNGIHATREIRERFPEVRVLALTTYDADEWVIDAIRAGANGYLLKDTPRVKLLEAIRGTAEGATHVDPKVAGAVFSRVAQGRAPVESFGQNPFRSLTERELEVLRLIARGLSNAEISRSLYLSEGTVRNHVSALLAKLEVADRTQAAILALRHGLELG